MKRITFFICTLGSGGAEHQMSLLANFMTERGYQTEIVTFGDIDDHYPLDKRVGRIRLASGKSKLAKTLAIFRYFLFVKTDCIISFSQRANMLMLPAMFFRRKPKVIVGERNYTVGPSDRIEQSLFRYLYRKSDYIVPNSHAQGEYISKMKPSLQTKIRVITNYTDLKQYNVQPQEFSGAVKIGIFCRYAEQKNYERFLRAVAIAKRQTDLEFHVSWYGSKTTLGAESQDYSRFMALVSELDLQDTVSANDSVKNVAELLPHFNVLCLPSLYEGFSNSLSEYICAGRAVIASDVSDNSVMVHDGENGYLFNPLDVQDMADIIADIVSKSSIELTFMGYRSREIAESLFDKRKFVNSYIDLIES